MISTCSYLFSYHSSCLLLAHSSHFTPMRLPTTIPSPFNIMFQNLYLPLVFYNPSVSNLLQPTCPQNFSTQFASNLLQLNSFQPFTIQLFLPCYIPAASNCYKNLSKFWKTENVPNSKLLQPSFLQSFTTQLLLTFYKPTVSNHLQPSCFKLLQNFYNPTASDLLQTTVSNLFQSICF